MSAVFVVVFVLGMNLVLGSEHMSRNDMHLAWVISPERFFVPVPSAPGAVETNPELVAVLHNPRERFLKTKLPGALRIFCVGGSTTRGWPFHAKLSYPALLTLYLRDLFPNRIIEVINAGFMASDSTSDLPLVTELLEYNPDLILLYTGRNEEWNLPFHLTPRTLKLQVWLMRNIRLYGFMREQREIQAGSVFDHAKAIRNWAKAHTNAEGKTLSLAVNNRMEENIRAMAEKAAKKKCILGILTQISSSKESPESSTIYSINLRLKSLASQLKLPILDLDRVFKRSKLRWDTLFIDFTPHPDLTGYGLLARSIAGWIASMGIIAPEKEWRWEKLSTQETYLAELGVTPAFLAGTYANLYNTAIQLEGNTKEAEKYRAKALNCLNNSCR